MDRQALLVFVNRILNGDSRSQAIDSLIKLSTLLAEQGAPQDDIALLDLIIPNFSEAQEIARKKVLTDEDVEIIELRAKERARKRKEQDDYWQREAEHWNGRAYGLFGRC